nr:copia protein [Tanacetum cinerariifolium]
MSNPHPKWNFVPRTVLMRSGLKTLNTARQNSSRAVASVNTARQINTAHPKTTVYSARPMSRFSKSAQSTVKRPYQIRTALTNKNFSQRVNTVKGKFNTTRPNSTVVNVVRENQVNAVKASACWEKGVIDSGCSRHMNGNMSYLSEYEEINGGYVAFGGDPKRGKITGKGEISTGKARVETVPETDYILLSLWSQDPLLSSSFKDSLGDGFKPSEEENKNDEDPGNEDNKVLSTWEQRANQEKDTNVNSTNNINTVSPTANAASINDNVVNENIVYGCADDLNMPNLEEIVYSYEDEDVGAEVDMTNLDTNILRAIETKWIYRNKKDERGIMVRNKASLVAQGYTQEEVIDYNEVFVSVARIEAIRLFLAYVSFKDFVVYKMDVKSAFLYGKIEEEVYVCQPLGFEDPEFPDRVYKAKVNVAGLTYYCQVTVGVTTAEKKFAKNTDFAKIVDFLNANPIMKPKRKATKISQSSGPTTLVADEIVHKERRDRVERATTTAASLDAKQDSGGSSRLQDTILGDRPAQTRFERLSKQSHEPPLLRVNTLGIGEDSMQLMELMALCITLFGRVFALENNKTTRDLKITHPKKRVKRLKKKRNSRTPQLKRRLFKVRIESSGEKSLGDQEDASKQERNDQDEGISFVQEDVETQGTYGHDIEVNTTSTSITTACYYSSWNASRKIVPPQQQLDPKDKGKGIMQEPEKPVKVKGKDQIALDEEVVRRLEAQMQAEFEKEERVARQREGKRIPPQQQLDPKDKGKGIMQEPEIQVKVKGKDQIALDVEVAQRLEAQMQAEFEEEERVSRQRKEEANLISWDNTQAMMEADYEVHHVSTENGIAIYMLVEKKYPLSRGTLTLMLVAKLLVDQDNEMSKELLRKIFIQAERPRR